MSRSPWAWIASCVLALIRPGRLVAVALLSALLVPAVSSAKPGGSSHRNRHAIQAPSRPAATPTASHARGPQLRHNARKPPLLAVGSGYGRPGGSGAVRSLQRRLLGAGYVPGPIDGLFGPRTEAAVMRFQASHGLVTDGIAGPRTLGALASSAALLYPGSPDVRRVRALQRRLARAGYAPGPIDGRFGPRTERAVQRFQAAKGLPADGVVGPRTLGRLRVRGTQPARTSRSAQSRRAQAPQHRRTPTSKRASRAYQPSRPGGTTTPVAHAPAPAHAHRGGGAASAVWLAILVALGVVLLVGTAWQIRRRRSRRAPAYRPAPDNGHVQPALAHLIEAGGPSRPHREEREAMGRLERLNEQVGAEAAYRRADEEGDPEGSFQLGALLERRGDFAGAIAAFKRAEEGGHAGAACALGVMLEGQGYTDAAERAYRRADRAGDADGAFNLAALLERKGDFAGAKGAYERAEERGLSEAATDLGVMLAAQGDLDGSAAAFRRADQRGDARGSFNLGVLLSESGDVGEAASALQRAAERGSPEVAGLARDALQELAAGEQRWRVSGGRRLHRE